jgi:hypothetical protein
MCSSPPRTTSLLLKPNSSLDAVRPLINYAILFARFYYGSPAARSPLANLRRSSCRL